MNHTLPQTTGIDSEIQFMQQDIYAELEKQSFSTLQGYGRMHSFPGLNGKLPMFFDGTDYKDVYLDDQNDISFFFIDAENHTTKDGILWNSPVQIVFWVNLKKLDQNYRADAEAHRLIISMLSKDVIADYQIKGIKKGVDLVFKGYDTSKIQLTDLKFWHLFSVEIDLSYYLTKKCLQWQRQKKKNQSI